MIPSSSQCLFVFDIDGTITDSVAIHQKAFREMLLRIGVQNLDVDFKKCKHHTDSFILRAIYENDQNQVIPQEKVIEFEKGLTEIIENNSILEIKGAKKLMEYITHQTNHSICYATGSLRRAAIHKLESVGITFDDKQLVASDMIMERELIVSQAIEHAKNMNEVSSFQRIISIGDGLWDLQTAQNLGIEFIGIGNNEQLLNTKSNHVHFENLEEMHDNLNSLLAH